MLSSVTEMLVADSMSRVDFEPTFLPHQRRIFTGPHAAVVEEDVVVGAHRQSMFSGVSGPRCGAPSGLTCAASA